MIFWVGFVSTRLHSEISVLHNAKNACPSSACFSFDVTIFIVQSNKIMLDFYMYRTF